MKNDIRKADEVTVEMRVNDIIYGIISDELDNMICDREDLPEEFESCILQDVCCRCFKTTICPFVPQSDFLTMWILSKRFTRTGTNISATLTRAQIFGALLLSTATDIMMKSQCRVKHRNGVFAYCKMYDEKRMF